MADVFIANAPPLEDRLRRAHPDTLTDDEILGLFREAAEALAIERWRVGVLRGRLAALDASLRRRDPPEDRTTFEDVPNDGP